MRVQTLILDLMSKKRLLDQTLSQTQPNPNNFLELIQKLMETLILFDC